MHFLKKHFFTIILSVLLLVLLLVPGVKAFLLQTFMRTGLLNAPVKKEIIVPAGNFSGLSFVNDQSVNIHTANLRGKIIFINFWASWCPPCVAEMSSINALYNQLKTDPRFVFILADTDNDFSKSVSFMQRNGYHLPVYQISSGVPDNLFSGSLPTTIIIDGKGDIVYKHEGIADYNTAAMINLLRSL